MIWGEHVRLLTANDFRLTERYYCLHRHLLHPVEEYISEREISLVYRGRTDDRRYELYRRAERLGAARLVRANSLDGDRIIPIGLVAALWIEPRWRRHNLGRWLVNRMINDAEIQGLRQLVAFVAMDQYAANSLMIQQGFDELHYRGYSLEKRLTE